MKMMIMCDWIIFRPGYKYFVIFRNLSSQWAIENGNDHWRVDFLLLRSFLPFIIYSSRGRWSPSTVTVSHLPLDRPWSIGKQSSSPPQLFILLICPQNNYTTFAAVCQWHETVRGSVVVTKIDRFAKHCLLDERTIGIPALDSSWWNCRCCYVYCSNPNQTEDTDNKKVCEDCVTRQDGWVMVLHFIFDYFRRNCTMQCEGCHECVRYSINYFWGLFSVMKMWEKICIKQFKSRKFNYLPSLWTIFWEVPQIKVVDYL